jgi:hypothetical protein
LTRDQRRELSERAGLGPFDGKALGVYIVGLLFGEPEDDLLKRVREIRDRELERFRAEIMAERAEREKERAEREQQRARARAGSRTARRSG